ncbi:MULTISPECIES: PDR/VanB family oxidoreductase [Ensifer]|uniref:PDR/VanB family oxidoreductase n=1 Tax=Ensifer TaxID=106591 RepID=UPI000709710C|nr:MULTISPECIES: PDR/VanB family oxidoreductase [Ensifer]KQY72497.1 Vanillate O-demethylase oxidoreductase [Ensifer sp. Root142]MBD9489464.1 oxidoreductase [Ensifer sp. ENS11]MDP9632701.1 vanillate O-demethylase ferredoxin subunit [Ensifer adhaerens]NOV17778.1 oxidoreductase [Ensifer canadensis]
MTEEILSLKVVERNEDLGGVLRLTLVSADGRPLPAFDAGAHLDMHVKHGDVDLWRQYSLCGDPGERNVYRLGILKDPKSRGGSVAVHEMAREGAVLEANVPRNHFPLKEEAERSILLGGGIGITPMLAMAHRLGVLGREFELHYCTRSRSVTAFLDILEAVPFFDRIRFHHDDEKTCFVPATLPRPTPETHLYVCGPQGFMDWLIGAAQSAGYASDHIHREYFGANVDLTGGSFEVEARASGISVTVGPGDTIAKALAKVGIDVEVKCEEGVCGTCLTEIIEGVADHRDMFLTDEEKAQNAEMTVCCSRAKSRKLVLNI